MTTTEMETLLIEGTHSATRLLAELSARVLDRLRSLVRPTDLRPFLGLLSMAMLAAITTACSEQPAIDGEPVGAQTPDTATQVSFFAYANNGSVAPAGAYSLTLQVSSEGWGRVDYERGYGEYRDRIEFSVDAARVREEFAALRPQLVTTNRNGPADDEPLVGGPMSSFTVTADAVEYDLPGGGFGTLDALLPEPWPALRKRLDDRAAQASSLREARTRWADVGPDRYTFRVTFRCRCDRDLLRPVTVEASADGVTSAVYVEGGMPVDRLLERYRSVPGLFDEIEAALSRGGMVAVTYDQRSGYPIEGDIDPSLDVVDDQYTFILENFEAL